MLHCASRMRSHCSTVLLLCATTLLSIIFTHDQAHANTGPSPAPLPSFAFNWRDGKSAFYAGDAATIEVKQLLQSPFRGRMVDLNQHPVAFSLSVNGKKGNSSFVSGVCLNTKGDLAGWNITFVPIMAGDFVLLIEEITFGIVDSSLKFSVAPGPIYPSGCLASWMGYNEVGAGNKASISILPTDAFGNKLAKGAPGPTDQYFNLSVSYENGSSVRLADFKYQGWNEEGYIILDFALVTSGNFLVHVLGDNRELRDSPLLLAVKPGPIDSAKSIGKWWHETNIIRIFSNLELLLYQKDIFGNPVPGMHPFDARVVKKSSNLSVPIPDLKFREVAEGIQLLSFTVSEQGEFILTVFDTGMNFSSSNMVFEYKVFVGYCDGLKSFANGSGLASSVAGRRTSFMVFLLDQYNNPSPVKAEMLHVQFLSTTGTAIHSTVFPLRNRSGGAPSGADRYFSKPPDQLQDTFSVSHDQTILGNPAIRASDYSISYTPSKFGDYEIWVSCGNVPINRGRPYQMRVSPGTANIAKSSVIKFEALVKISTKSEVVLQLLDSTKNPIISSGPKLHLQIGAKNDSTFTTYPFVERDGLYHGYYVVKEVGSYNVCVLLEDKALSPCPFEVQVREDKYFSMPYDDTISVWEDESSAFDVLSNDYMAGGRADIIESSIPNHGSLLRYGDLFRYSPYKGYFGNDSFNYTISDRNNNTATADVFISVLCKPPQFSSLPFLLNITEETLSPKFSESGRIAMTYSDALGNISVTIRAQSGTISLAPISMQFLQPTGSTVTVRRGGLTGKELVIVGQVETINSALQSVQYIGKENFYGNDTIFLYAMNNNGVQEAYFSVVVEPVNDPSFVNAPKSIYLGGKESSDGIQIFDKHRDTFEFSILDPDIFNFPGNKSDFLLMLSLEVDEGELMVTLPVSLIRTAEFKSQYRKVWQLLQTYVTISNHFVLKGKGIRFQGTHLDCNNALQRLYYKSPNHEAVLTVTVNDLGNYGCYPDCVKMRSLPLSTQFSIHLNKRRPINSIRNFLIISTIIIEILTMVVMGGVLLFFMCRCMNDLYGRGKDSDGRAASSPSDGSQRRLTMDSPQVQPMMQSFASTSQVRQRSRRRLNEKSQGMVELQTIPSPSVKN